MKAPGNSNRNRLESPTQAFSDGFATEFRDFEGEGVVDAKIADSLSNRYGS